MGRDRVMNLLAAFGRDVVLGQACDTLISSLGVADGGLTLRTFVVTSAQPAEGKTTVAVCLALRMAAAGKRVLLIDADLRRPMVHRLLGVDNAQGMVHLLNGGSAGASAVQDVDLAGLLPGAAGTLAVLTSGRTPRSATAVLQTASFSHVLRDVGAGRDAVVIDSPPVLSVSDSLWLVRHVDGVILVLNTGSTAEADARQAKGRIEEAGGRVLGVVLNRFDERLHGPGFHPYHAYYEIEFNGPGQGDGRASRNR
jgi:capsular exopolysaccharide synthesis family protein